MALSGPSRHQPEHSTELAPQALSGGFVRPHSTQLPWHSSTWLLGIVQPSSWILPSSWGPYAEPDLMAAEE